MTSSFLVLAAAVTALFLLFVVIIYTSVQAASSDKYEDRLERYVPAAIADDRDDADANQQLIRSRVRRLEKSQKRTSRGITRVRKAIIEAGIDASAYNVYLITITGGLIATLVYMVLGYPLVAAPVVFAITAYVIPLSGLKIMAAKRQKAFTRRFPDALDIITRGLKQGLPLSETFTILARETDPPVCDIFRRLVDETAAGMTVEDAMNRAYQRMPTSEMKFFATVVNVQNQTGGNLADIVENISSVIRGRAHLKQKIKSYTAEARFNAIILGSLPFLLGGAFTAISPDHLTPLFTTQLGNFILIGFGILMALGIFVMYKMAQIKV